METRRNWYKMVFCGWLLCALTACAAWPSLAPVMSPLAPEPSATPTSLPPTSTVTPLPTATAAAAAAATASPTPTATATPLPGPRLDPALVRVYPLPAAIGDALSLDIEPVLSQGYDAPFTVTLALPDGRLFSSPVVPVGFDRQPRARFIWVWDTTGLSGAQPITVTLLTPPDIPDGARDDNVLTFAVPLLDAAMLPPPEPGARWATQTVEGVRLFYVTGSAAERDLSTLLALSQSAYADVAAHFDVTTTETVDVYVMDRIVGQGGYATSDWVAVSYTDRAYAPAEMTLLLRHELTHRLDSAWRCDGMPSMLREGLAVMVAGGHYWPESLPRKAAALLQTDAYIPLEQLLNDFYRQQHEIGYLEAGALVAYIVEERGWQGIRTLCETFAASRANDAVRFARALEAVGLPSLPQLEQDWLRWLRVLHVTEAEVRVLEAEWLLMDTMRAYQRRYDPSANFLTGILFDPAMGAQRGIAADFVRRPRNAQAVALELLLQMAQTALRAADPDQAEALLAVVGAALEAPEFAAAPEAAKMAALVEAVVAWGYEPYRTVCVADGAEVGQRAPGCVVYALDLAEWPLQRLLWATRSEATGSWTVVGPQTP